MMKVDFEKANLIEKDTIFGWLEEPHVKEFWDNSPEHREDIEIFMYGRKTSSPYFNGIFDYWVGSIKSKPYSLIMTSAVNVDDDIPDSWLPYISKNGNTFGIDFMIGNTEFLGKGLAAPTLQAFVEFYRSQVDPMATTFIIDPSDNNPRAKHVYEKAGFKVVDTFVSKQGYFMSHKTFLMVKHI